MRPQTIAQYHIKQWLDDNFIMGCARLEYTGKDTAKVMDTVGGVMYSFEIVDELYGYNQVLYSGYLSILETEDLVQMDISIYFTGKIIYDTKE